MNRLTPLIGLLIFLGYLWRRLHFPWPRSFPVLYENYLWLLAYLCVQYLFLVLYALWLTRDSALHTVKKLGGTPWFPGLLRALSWLGKTPGLFYQKIRPYLGSPWENFLTSLRNGLSQKNPYYLFLTFYLIPGGIPPLVLIITFWLSGPLEYFYFSLPLLLLRWTFVLLLHVLTEWADRQVCTRMRQGYQGEIWKPSDTWIRDYYTFVGGNSFLGIIHDYMDAQKWSLFFWNSLLYSLAWWPIFFTAIWDQHSSLLLILWA